MVDFYEDKVKLAHEILEKANLQYVSKKLEDFEDWNLIGTTPKDLTGNMPMQVLHCLNSEYGTELLKDAYSRIHLQKLYKKAPVIFSKAWNPDQCRFWEDFLFGEKPLVVDKNIVRIIKKLENREREYTYEEYRNYLIMCQELISRKVKMPLIPGDEDFQQFQKKASYILDCFANDQKINYMLLKQYFKKGRNLEYQDEKYKLIVLRSIRDFLKESEEQKNCLWSYILPACAGESIILALRKTEEPEKSYVTIEVEAPLDYMFLKQVKGKHNRDVCQEVKYWVTDYFMEKNISVIDCDDLFIDDIEANLELWGVIDDEGNLPF